MALAELYSRVHHADSFFTFECAAVPPQQSWILELQPCRRVSSSAAAAALQRLVLPTPGPVRKLAQAAMQAALDGAVSRDRALAPLQLQLRPFPFEWVVALPGWEQMQRTSDGESLLYIFADDRDFETVVGLVCWPTPTTLMKLRMVSCCDPPLRTRRHPRPRTHTHPPPRLRPSSQAKVAVPKLTDVELRAAYGSRCYAVRGATTGHKKKRSQLNYFCYNLDTMTFTLVANVAIFNNTSHVAGASLGDPPAEGGPYKYSLLEHSWVPRSEPAASRAALLARFGQQVAWPHW